MTTTRTTTRTPHRALGAAGALALALLLGACGSGGATTTSDGATGASGSGTQGQRTPPGVSGEIAAVTGDTLQVQTTTEQTAVTFGPTTPITQDVAATTAALTVGVCVTARPARDDTTGDDTAFTAATVAISAPVDGQCTAGFGAGGAGGGRRTGDGAGGGGGSRSGGAVAVGEVTSVSGSSVEVASVVGQGGAADTGTPSTTDVTVTTTSTTTLTEAQQATSAALVVGACVTALGRPDETGAVTATALTVRSATDGSCTGGRGQGAGAGA